MGYEHRLIRAPGPAAPPAAPAPVGNGAIAARIAESKRFLELLGAGSLQDAIDKMEEETGNDEWWDVGIVEGNQDDWSEWFDNILGADVEWDHTDEANKWIWEMWFTNTIARLELLGKISDKAKMSDFAAGLLAEYKMFRNLLDHMSLSDAILKIDVLTKSLDWFRTLIEDLSRDEWTELFERGGVDTELPSFNRRDEKYLWLWKKHFDEVIEDLGHPGKPSDDPDDKKADELEGKIRKLEQSFLTAIPLPDPAPAEEPLPELWPGAIPDHPAVPTQPSGGDTTYIWARIRYLTEYLQKREEYEEAILFNMGWMLEMIRVCLTELKAAKAPGTQTDNYKNNLKLISDGTFYLEQQGVFHD